MGANLFYGKISSVNYKAGTANVVLADRENLVIQSVPFLAMFYEMPVSGDTVAVIFEEETGQIGKGVILGKIFLAENVPAESGAGIFWKQFSDGSAVEYNPNEHALEIKTGKVVVDELVYNTLTQG